MEVASIKPIEVLTDWLRQAKNYSYHDAKSVLFDVFKATISQFRGSKSGQQGLGGWEPAKPWPSELELVLSVAADQGWNKIQGGFRFEGKWKTTLMFSKDNRGAAIWLDQPLWFCVLFDKTQVWGFCGDNVRTMAMFIADWLKAKTAYDWADTRLRWDLEVS